MGWDERGSMTDQTRIRTGYLFKVYSAIYYMSQPSSYSQQQNILLKKKKRGESRKLLT
jgi:hypothetical protein